MREHEYHGRVVEVRDGQTVVAEVDLGFGIKVTKTFTLTGLSAEKARTPLGHSAMYRLSELVGDGRVLMTTTKWRRGKKNPRYHARLSRFGTDINATLLAEGLATPYHEKRRTGGADAADADTRTTRRHPSA